MDERGTGPVDDAAATTRVAGLDLGSRRIGVAVSDPLGLTAQPHSVIDRSAHFAGELGEIVRSEQVRKLVVGLPLTLEGREGPAAEGVRAEAAELESALGIPVEFWDERLTTVTAEKVLLESGMRRNARRKVVDKVAAAVMLQSYLDAHRAEP